MEEEWAQGGAAAQGKAGDCPKPVVHVVRHLLFSIIVSPSWILTSGLYRWESERLTDKARNTPCSCLYFFLHIKGKDTKNTITVLSQA